MAGKQKGATTEGHTVASTTDGGASNLHLDARPVQPQKPKNNIAQETQRLDTQLAKCKVGVAWINLLEMQDRLKFGRYNDRPPNDTEINKLIGSFKASGIVAMKDVSAIPIIIDLKRIKMGLMLATGFDEPDDVPKLELADEKDITVASGQHRLAALCKYHQSVADELASLEKKRAKIAGFNRLSEGHIVMYADLRDKIGSLLGLLDGIGKWGVVIYDSNKLLAKDDNLATHLSRNNTLHEFKETEEEVLVSVFKKIQVIFKNSPINKQMDLAKIELQEARSKNAKNTRVQKVLHHENLCILLATRLLHLGPHIRRRQEFSVTWLAKSLDVCMGLYVLWIESRCKMLMRLSSHAPFPSYATVRQLLEKSEKGDTEAKDKLTELRQSMASCGPADEGELSIWAEVIEKLDSHTSAFDDHTDMMEDMSPSYIEALSTYRNKVIRTLLHAWSVKEGNHAADGENQIMKHLDSIIARVALHLTPSENAERAPEPLLGGFLMNYAWKYMTKLKAGIAEICRWFEALLDYWRFLHRKTHTMDDWSTVMLSNIAKDSRFEEQGSDIEVMQIIWDYRKTLVTRLDNAVTKSMRRSDNRPKDKKAFDAAIERFQDTEQIASQALQQLVLKKRGKHAVSNRDLSNESLGIAGTLALHVTAWDWHSLSIKNPMRDMQPCINAITLEHTLMLEYRPKLFRDKWAGSLRRIIELCLSKRLEAKQKMTSRKELYTVQQWTWWDGLTLSDALEDPSKILNEIYEDLVNKQHRQQERLAFETRDRDAIQKIVNYVANMPCSKAFGTPQSNMSHEVVMALTQLVDALELNSTRLRARAIANNDELQFDGRNIVDLHIQLPSSYQDENTMAYEDQDEDAADEDKAEINPGHQMTQQHTDNRQLSVSLDNDANDRTPPDAERSIPKARPVPRKRRQQSPVPDHPANDVDKQDGSRRSSSTSTVYVASMLDDDVPDVETARMIVDNASPRLSSRAWATERATDIAATSRPAACHDDINTVDNTMDIGVLICLIASIHHEPTLFQFQTLKRLVPPPMALFHLGTHMPMWNMQKEQMFLAPVIQITSPTKVRAWNSGQTHSHSTIDTEVLCLAASKELCVQRIIFKCPLRVSNLTLLDRPLSVAATVASSAASSSSKRARTATDASNASLSPARGKKSKKNARTRVHEPAEDDEDECTFVPGV
ncbi:hypothetical protein BDR03DRAFT_1018338 [Suillus americanus]|nr:hypothetical protein BDR03DRAFT_1018338 [Suillus americanus]